MGNTNASAVTMPARAEIEAIAGHQFAGGEYTIAHWENVLLTGCTGADLLPECGMRVRPTEVAFHASQQACIARRDPADERCCRLRLEQSPDHDLPVRPDFEGAPVVFGCRVRLAIPS